MTAPEPLHPLLIQGGPRARGRAHGEALRSRIKELLQAWSTEVQAEAGEVLDAYLARFTRQTHFLADLERWTPGLLQEVEGIAEGAEISLRDCLCLQLMDEHWAHLARLERTRAGSGKKGRGRRPPERCSCLGQVDAASGAVTIAQNMDLPCFLDGFQTLLRVRYPQGGPELLVPTYPGFIGLLGVSDRGLGVCVNALSQLRCVPRGLPVAFVIRALLEQPGLDAAVGLVRGLPHATGQNYLLAGAEGLVDLEGSAGGVVRYVPPGGAAAPLCHTNHPLASRDLAREYAAWDADPRQADQAHALTLTRLASLQGALSHAPLDLAGIQAGLAAVSHGLDSPFDAFTFCSGVLQVGPKPCLHLAAGPARRAPYQAHGF